MLMSRIPPYLSRTAVRAKIFDSERVVDLRSDGINNAEGLMADKRVGSIVTPRGATCLASQVLNLVLRQYQWAMRAASPALPPQ